MKHFITFEGIDGSGKTTILDGVYSALLKKGYSVIKTKEPTDSEIGKFVQKCISTNYDPIVTSFTFISDRIMHGKEIQKWLDEGNIVLCDRYAESTYAYQGAQLEESIDKPIKWLKDLSINRFPIPDRTFLFLINPEQAIKRIQNRNQLIPFEKVSFLEKVHKNYEDISDQSQIKIIDAAKSINYLTDLCIKDILE